MNILYINHYAGSPEMGMEFRPYYLSKEWIKMGHRVDIIAADYSHMRINNPAPRKDFAQEVIDGIHYHWIHTGTYQGNGIARLKTMFWFVAKLYLSAKILADTLQPDVIITSSTYPLDTYAGQRIKKYRPTAKLIHEIHDMWPAVLTEVNGMSKYHPFVLLMQMAENSFCKQADKVISLLPGAKTYLIEHGMQADKFLAVTNGVNVEDWLHAEKLNDSTEQVLTELKKRNQFIICFFGSITNYYALPELIAAVQRLDNENITVVIVGEGNFKEHLMQLAAKKNREKFLFLPKIPKKQVPELLKKVDALYVGGVKKSVFKYGISMNKLFDSMMSGKPIIYAVDAPNNYIEEYKCGISVEAGNVDALAEGIDEIFRMPVGEREQLGDNGHEATARYFTYPKLADKIFDSFAK